MMYCLLYDEETAAWYVKSTRYGIIMGPYTDYNAAVESMNYWNRQNGEILEII